MFPTPQRQSYSVLSEANKRWDINTEHAMVTKQHHCACAAKACRSCCEAIGMGNSLSGIALVTCQDSLGEWDTYLHALLTNAGHTHCILNTSNQQQLKQYDSTKQWPCSVAVTWISHTSSIVNVIINDICSAIIVDQILQDGSLIPRAAFMTSWAWRRQRKLYFGKKGIFSDVATQMKIGTVVSSPQPHDSTISLSQEAARLPTTKQLGRTSTKVLSTFTATKEMFDITLNGWDQFHWTVCLIYTHTKHTHKCTMPITELFHIYCNNSHTGTLTNTHTHMDEQWFYNWSKATAMHCTHNNNNNERFV